ncbi:glycoside hydrolase family 16 protein [Kineococcus sp. DHX-1]|uniref:glycoside hydrolase family 16 protein n=1 Tax=Kineococcus sp. DHX-1 TaxID=3349638 RepID=UPI0036D3E448
MACSGPADNTSPPPSRSSPDRWTLSWQDDFDGASGTAPDSRTWTPELGGGGWGNEELQTYTDAPENVSLDGRGHLVITARRSSFDPSVWTSARITTFGKRTTRHGRVEVRAKVPSGQGIWPAAWTLGQNIQDVGWPASGEIDLIESVGTGREALQTAHGARRDGSRWLQTFRSPRGESLSEDFHVYGVEWSSERLQFSIDGRETGVLFRSDLPDDEVWPFDAPQYVLLNVAVGGNLPGAPDATTPPEAPMLVDWVRAYD